jgi:FAD/FMN-containing dehydrogenase
MSTTLPPTAVPPTASAPRPRAQPADGPLLPRLAAIVGEKHVITDPDIMRPHLVEWRGIWTGAARAVVRPGSTAEVAAIVRVAAETQTPIVPQGGNTGGVGGQTPDGSGRALVLSLARMTAIRALDTATNAITVEAGVTLKAVQDAAEAADRLFPMSLASEGTCTIGGNLASNAGGTNVIAYGNMRDLALGIEVVLADGRVWNGLSALRKDNTGYDLKHLFIGSEGTLGIITAATLKLYPRPRARATAFVAVPTPAAALALLRRLEGAAEGAVTTFELLPRLGVTMVTTHVAAARDPFADTYPWYALIELSGGDGERLNGALEEALGHALEAEEALDATIAASLDQRQQLWRLREDLPLAQGFEGGSIKHDISVAVADIPAFMDETLAMLAERFPGCRPCPFGHMGDGNLHFNVTQPEGADKAAFLAQYDAMNEAVYEIVARYKGSIAAEHGVGQMKRRQLPRYKDPVALDLMRLMKRTLDPAGIMNPGKVL